MNHKSTVLIAGALFAAGLLTAQTAPTAAGTNAQPLKAGAVSSVTGGDTLQQLEAYEVTGSRIRLNAGEAPAIPVFELSRVQLEEMGVNRLADIRQAIPQLAPAVGFNDNLANGGPSRGQMVGTSFNLRGLGGNSTLVLVDGQRVPHTGQEAPGGAGGREDFNIDGIPVNAIERIEVLPQGASAVYGSEAIGGVVNVILKKNYSGAQLSVNYDNTFKSDVGDVSVALTAGHRAGKVSTFLTLNWEKQNGMRGADRWFTSRDSSFYGASASYLNSQVAGGAGALSSTTSPLNANQANLAGLTTNIVAIPAGSKGSGLTTANYVAAGAPSTPFDPAPYNSLIDEARRRSLVFKLTYDLSAAAQPYLQVRKSRFENFYTATPQTLSIALPVGAPGNPFTAPAYVRKVFWDLPRYHQDSYQDNTGVVAGVRGRFLDNGVAGGRFLRDWRYDLTGNFSRNVIDDVITVNTFNTTAVTAALNDANPANRPILAYDSTVAGNNPNAAGVLEKFLVAPSPHHHDYTDVFQYTFRADGTLWSGWAGDVKGAFGGESSEEKVHFYRDPGAASYFLTKPFGRRVTAAFAEVSLPLLSARQRVPVVHRLDVGAAVRTEDFSDMGSHRTPRYNALYQPFKWLTFRASRSEGFKVPRMYDLQGPVTSGSKITLTAASNVRDTLRGGEAVIGTFDYSSGGNPNLGPETSVSKTGGVVIDVPGKWFKGLSVSVDTWELHYFNKVGSAGYQVLVDFFPERVTRAASRAASDPAGYANPITGFNSTAINLARYDTRGVDYSMSYQRATPFGQLTMSGAFSDPKLIAAKSTPSATTWSRTWLPMRMSGSAFLRRGAWSFGTTMSYQAPYRLSTSATAFPYPSLVIWNPQLAYDFSRNPGFNEKAGDWWCRWLAGTRVSVTVPNVFNAEPSTTDVYSGRYGVYDARLRRYVLNFSKKL